MRVVIYLDFVHKIKRMFQENITLLFSASLYDFVMFVCVSKPCTVCGFHGSNGKLKTRSKER